MLDLNEITAACESLTCDKHRGWTEGEEFIARARTWLPALIDELQGARAEIERLHILIESAAMTIGMVTTGQAQTLARRIEEAQE